LRYRMEGFLSGTFRSRIVSQHRAMPQSVLAYATHSPENAIWVPIGLSDPDGSVNGKISELSMLATRGRSHRADFLVRQGMDGRPIRVTWPPPADFSVSHKSSTATVGVARTDFQVALQVICRLGEPAEASAGRCLPMLDTGLFRERGGPYKNRLCGAAPTVARHCAEGSSRTSRTGEANQLPPLGKPRELSGEKRDLAQLSVCKAVLGRRRARRLLCERFEDVVVARATGSKRCWRGRARRCK